MGGRTVGLVKNGVFTALATDTRGTVMSETTGTPRIASPFGQRDVHPTTAAAIDYVEKGFDADLGLVRMGVRDYDPEINRFTTADPLFLEEPGRCADSPMDCNLYGYARGSPILLVDPSGRMPDIAAGLLSLFLNGGPGGGNAVAREPLLYSSGPTHPDNMSKSPELQSVKFDSGRYGSVTSVIRPNGEIRAFQSQTWGISKVDKVSRVETKPGAYEYRFGQHPMTPQDGNTPYPALNVYTTDGGRDLPASRNDGQGETASGINIHKGYGFTSGGVSGSAACHVIPKENWDSFIGSLRQGDSGPYRYFDLTQGGN